MGRLCLNVQSIGESGTMSSIGLRDIGNGVDFISSHVCFNLVIPSCLVARILSFPRELCDHHSDPLNKKKKKKENTSRTFVLIQ